MSPQVARRVRERLSRSAAPLRHRISRRVDESARGALRSGGHLDSDHSRAGAGALAGDGAQEEEHRMRACRPPATAALGSPFMLRAIGARLRGVDGRASDPRAQRPRVWRRAGGRLWESVRRPDALYSLQLTVLMALAMVVVNVAMGTLTAWVLVRYKFPGQSLVNMLIDLPFAVPTVVTGLMLVILYGPQSSVGTLSLGERRRGHLRKAGDRARAALRHAALRRSFRPAGPHGARQGDGRSGGDARGQPVGRVSKGDRSRRFCPRCSPEPLSRSAAPSASSGRW